MVGIVPGNDGSNDAERFVSYLRDLVREDEVGSELLPLVKIL